MIDMGSYREYITNILDHGYLVASAEARPFSIPFAVVFALPSTACLSFQQGLSTENN